MIRCLKCHSDQVDEVVVEYMRYYYCQGCGKIYERALDSSDGRIMSEITKSGLKHFIIGALIEKNSKYLMIKRRSYPFGYSFPFGHIHYGETKEEALKREVFEETGLLPKKYKLLFSGDINSKCHYGSDLHHLDFYEFTAIDTNLPILSNESEILNWYNREEISKLPLTFVAKMVFNKMIK